MSFYLQSSGVTCPEACLPWRPLSLMLFPASPAIGACFEEEGKDQSSLSPFRPVPSDQRLKVSVSCPRSLQLIRILSRDTEIPSDLHTEGWGPGKESRARHMPGGSQPQFSRPPLSPSTPDCSPRGPHALPGGPDLPHTAGLKQLHILKPLQRNHRPNWPRVTGRLFLTLLRSHPYQCLGANKWC